MKGKYLNDDFFARLETLSLHLQADLIGYFGGKHQIKKYGQTVEFADFREYRLGDDIRRIDWNLYARFGKYFLKLFTDERQMHVRIFLDCSASMGACAEKAEYALGAAAAIGFLAVRNTDKVSFHLLKDGVVENPFGIIVGKNSFFAAMGALKKLEFSGEADFSLVPDVPDTGTGDGLAVVVSDFFTDSDWKKAVDYFLYKKRQVLLTQILDAEEINPRYSGRFNLVDAEAAGAGDSRNLRLRITRSMLDDYENTLGGIVADIKKFCSSRGVVFMRFDTSKSIEKSIFGGLLQSDFVR